jgi:translocation and assembly module TamB
MPLSAGSKRRCSRCRQAVELDRTARRAPFGGGIRYNGPASVLTSLAGLTGHQLQDRSRSGADFSGRVNNPQLVGLVRANNLTYTNER